MNLKSIHQKSTLSRLLNGLFAVVILIILFNPSAKALLIRGLMKVGLFQLDIAQPLKTVADKKLPDINFQSTNGQIMKLTNQKGKVIFMNFWATWCPPCIAEMPTINELQQKLKNNKNIIFIMVDTDHNFSKSVPFMSEHHFNLPLYQANNMIPENLLGNAIPTTVIFDKGGKMVFRHEGGADYSSSQILAYLTLLAN
jgi:thiol-disulfide isomerase/thioredoxin